MPSAYLPGVCTVNSIVVPKIKEGVRHRWGVRGAGERFSGRLVGVWRNLAGQVQSMGALTLTLDDEFVPDPTRSLEEVMEGSYFRFDSFNYVSVTEIVSAFLEFFMKQTDSMGLHGTEVELPASPNDCSVIRGMVELLGF